jgi:hypothetical protein
MEAENVKQLKAGDDLTQLLASAPGRRGPKIGLGVKRSLAAQERGSQARPRAERCRHRASA